MILYVCDHCKREVTVAEIHDDIHIEDNYFEWCDFCVTEVLQFIRDTTTKERVK